MKKALLILSLSALVAAVAYAYDIVHPNLKEAHGLAEQAIHHIQRAQQANAGVEFGGHAEKAIDLLRQAQAEIVEGDKYNEAHKKH
jgi:hydroxymethylpyrimidine/phosphomethylpyrimidine kinase